MALYKVNLPEPEYKFDELTYLHELASYVKNTYDQHYSKSNFQATEFILDCGHGPGFCIGNILKYAQRYQRKGDPDEWRKDLLKICHYAIIALYNHDKNYERNVDYQEELKRSAAEAMKTWAYEEEEYHGN